MSRKLVITQFVILALFLSLVVIPASAAQPPGSLNFSNTPLLRSEGDSEPAITIGGNGALAVTGLQWQLDPNTFATYLWTGSFGTTPNLQGSLDADMQKSGKLIIGGGDADVDIGSTGTMHATTLIHLVNPVFNTNNFQLGVSAITCPNATSPTFNLNNCTKKIIDTTQADRPWVTSEGSHVYISYHDSGNSSLIHVQRSDDDGYTWKKVGDPIVGHGNATGNSTFNSIQGPLVADPVTHNVYAIYAAGEAIIYKGGNGGTYNNIYFSRSTDQGETWTTGLVYHAPLFTDLVNVFAALAVDPITGNLYAAWSDAHSIYFSTSNDQGISWSPAVTVNVVPANTALLPWLAAYNGTVDLVYYATTAGNKDDPTAVWNVYLAQTTNQGGSFTQNLVSNTPNHVGAVCTHGCGSRTKTLLDLFEVSINPQNGLAGVIYTDDTLTKTDSGAPLPQIVLAQQNP